MSPMSRLCTMFEPDLVMLKARENFVWYFKGNIYLDNNFCSVNIQYFRLDFITKVCTLGVV